jgi:hypothetical protein
VDKAIDKKFKKNDEAIQAKQELGQWLKKCRGDRPQKDISKHFLSKTGGVTGCVANWELGFNLPTWEIWIKLKDLLLLDDRFDYLIEGRPSNFIEAEREVIGKGFRIDRHTSAVPYGSGTPEGDYDITAPSTDAAKQWSGYGTSLKPAVECWWLFRKPLEEKTIAENVLRWSTGAINIDACRVATNERAQKVIPLPKENHIYGDYATRSGYNGSGATSNLGRFPANFILSYPEDSYDAQGRLLPNPAKDAVLAMFPETKSGDMKPHKNKQSEYVQLHSEFRDINFKGDSGSAARFSSNVHSLKKIIIMIR